MKKTNRRTFIRRGAVAAAAVTAAAVPSRAEAQGDKAAKKVHYRNGRKPEKPPLFNGTISYGSLVFIAGVGYHMEGDIKVHTKGVLDQIQQQLESIGSSMEKVLKCNVYLNDLNERDVQGTLRPRAAGADDDRRGRRHSRQLARRDRRDCNAVRIWN